MVARTQAMRFLGQHAKEGCLDTWILSSSISGTAFGDLSLASIKRTVTQELMKRRVTGVWLPETIPNYFPGGASLVTGLATPSGSR